jgi:FG-GAP-like repeat
VAPAASCSNPNFGSQPAVAVGEGPEAIVAEDFDHDGRLDFAVANFVSDDVSVLIGDENVGFAPKPGAAVGDGPSHVLSEDLNRDGNADLVTVNEVSDNVSVLLGDGAGGFAQHVNYPTFSSGNHQPVEVAAGDLTGDGKLDLAVAHLFNGVSVLPGDGQGGFHAPLQVEPWPDGNPGSIVAGDFNGNGDIDVAVGRIGNQDTAIHFNSSNPSKPLFFSNDAVPGVSRSVTAGDLNRDGHLDLVGLGHSPDGNDAVGVALWQGGHWDIYEPQFAAPSFHPIPTGNLPTSVVPADFNGDGNPDLAVSNRASDDVSILFGDGAGGFGPQTAFPAGDGPEDLAAGDFDSDGAIDLVVANNRSNSVSILSNNCPVGPIDLEPTTIEVTQSVQDLSNTVPLFEGKRTVARVHISTNVDVTRVGARLYGYDASGTPLAGGPLWPANQGAVIDPSTSPDRGKLDDSFNFELPPSWAKGAVTLKAEVNPYRTLAETDYTNNTKSIPAAFQPTKALKVRLVKYEYFDPKGKLHAPTDDQLAEIESRLRREFPIAKLSVSRTTFRDEEKEWDPSNFQFLDDIPVLLSRLQWFRHTYEPTNTGVVYLLVHDPFLTSGGIASGIPGWNGTAATPDVAAHEVGHLMGRKHVSCTPDTTDEAGPDLAYPYEGGKIGGPVGDTARFYGLDVGDASLSHAVLPHIVSNATGDTMSYCRPRWLSDYNYKAIQNHIQQNFSAVDPVGDFLSVYGTIDFEAQTASLPFVSRQPQVSEVPQRSDGPYHIRLFDAANNRLADYPFTPLPNTEGGSTANIAQIVDFVPGTRRLAIYSEAAGREIGSIAVSGNAPDISNLVARAPTEDGSIELSWDASDPDGGELNATVLYSNDGGTTWQTIAAGVRGTTFTADSSELPGSTSSIFRVVVDDGVLTAEAKSTPLDVPGKPPQARVTAPLTGSAYLLGQSIDLEGVGEDLEDGTLEDAKLSWSSDVDGPLGTGRLLHAQGLSEGTHHVTLTASDTDGQTDTATVVVNVVAGYENPDPDDSTPPTVDCGVPDAAWHAADVGIACTASDGGSGLANPGDASFSLSTDVAAGTEDSDAPTESRNVCDRAGNCAVAGPITGNKVDKQGPGIAISAPANGANYVLGQAVSADYACADGGSGVASCTGTAPDGANFDTSSLGTKAFQVNATDGVGNQSSRSVDYGVVYDFRGFFRPVDNPPTVNVVKAGSAVPVKFSLGNDYGLDIFAEGYPQSGRVANDPNAAMDNIEVTVSAGSSGLSYDAAAKQYTYVWKSSKEWAGTSRQLIVKLEDGTEHIAFFKFTK